MPSRSNMAHELYLQGVEYAKYGLHDEAIELFRKSLATDPDNIDTCISLGEVYAEKRMDSEAIELFQKVLKINPNQPQVYFKIGTVYFDM